MNAHADLRSRLKRKDIINKLKASGVNRSKFSYDQINIAICLISFLHFKMDQKLDDIGILSELPGYESDIVINIDLLATFIISNLNRIQIVSDDKSEESKAFVERYNLLSKMAVSNEY